MLNHTADLVQAVRAGRSLTDALGGVPGAVRPAVQALAFHAMRWLGSAEVLRRTLAPKAPPTAVDALLLTALALLWPPSTPPYPDHTLVDQAVEATRTRAARAAGFVNAVLRRFLRERDALVAAALADPLARTNHPAWWVERLRADWPDRWEALLQANQQHPPMTLRVNARRSSAAAYVERLAQHGIVGHAGAGHAVTLERPLPVTRLPGFAAGDVSVQDAAAQWPARLLVGGDPSVASPDEGPEPRSDVERPPAPSRAWLAPGSRVLDACAAPGGKTAQLLELADLDLLAIDASPARLERVDETLARLGLAARTLAADAGEPAAWWDGRPFDAILLDAPCTASGIVRRHPDVRWLRRPDDVAALVATQRRLLDALWPLLRPGGRLLYCTCSLFKDEGEHQLDAFLQRHADARTVAEPAAPGHLLPLADNRAVGPAASAAFAGDGFFIALVEKT
nr:16S rRNA (cytosine(967)-C(5))-methyltransferase RsmB [Schlegelella koreensis]